jgi:hypothetical protein
VANPRKSYSTFLFLFLSSLSLTGFLISGCGGGGGATGTSFPSKTLSWQPPVSYADSTPLNPAADLDSFEIYVKADGVFTPGDNPNASLAAYDSGTAQTATSFNLAGLGPYFSKGTVYHFAIRAVAKGGLKSDFSPSATFSF